MYQTSQEYKDLMKRPVRNQSFMKVQLGLINQDAQQSAELQDQEKYNGFSDPTSLYSQHTVKRYATYEKNMFRADGGMYFLPRSENDYSKDGITSKNLFAGTFSVKFVFGCGKSDIKGLTIRFGENYPTKFTIMTDSGEVNQYNNANATFETDSVFENTESIELSIIEMRFPNNRVRIDYIQFGLGLEYDNEWIKEASSTTSLSAINDDLPQSEFSITLNNDNQIFNVDNPASEINFLESGQKINVLMGYKLDSGSVEWMQMHSLYVHEWSADDEQATIGAEVSISVRGYKYNISTAYTVQSVNNRGNDKEWNNPLISDLEHSKELAEWVGDYYSSGIEYELDYRGEPAIDCGDTIRQENKYDSSLQAVVEESQISYDAGALSGGLRTRRKGNVERAKNRLV